MDCAYNEPTRIAKHWFRVLRFETKPLRSEDLIYCFEYQHYIILALINALKFGDSSGRNKICQNWLTIFLLISGVHIKLYALSYSISKLNQSE